MRCSGKKTCKILKEIRQQIAERNDIEYITSECHFQGECKGTCPKCEAELQYLENELSKRRQLGKAVAVAGISLGLMGTFPSCITYEQACETVVKNTVVVTPVYTRIKKGTSTSINGKIIDEDKMPLDFVTIHLIQNNTLVKRAETDERGLFTIDSVSAGKYEIRITYLGYHDLTIKEVEIKENAITYIDKVQLKFSHYIGLPGEVRINR